MRMEHGGGCGGGPSGDAGGGVGWEEVARGNFGERDDVAPLSSGSAHAAPFLMSREAHVLCAMENEIASLLELSRTRTAN